jgi:uncharacterized protein YecE (DUF72 family)
MATKRSKPGTIRTGMGGWTFAPWRGVFYPEGLAQKLELEYASRQVSAIEINGTYYRAPSPEVYRQWAATVPDGFVFSVKAPRHIVQTKALASTGDRVGSFLEGAAALGDRLGPVLWQFLPTRKFDPDDIAAFLDLLPEAVGGVPLRHAVEVRHESFLDPRWIELARARGVATVYTDSPDHPNLADLTGPFAYARLMRSVASRKTGYTAKGLEGIAATAAAWAGGDDPASLPHVGKPLARGKPKDVFIYFISAAKERNPAAAMALGKLAGTA